MYITMNLKENRVKWYLQCLKKYASFNGRARRSEFWFFQLIQGGVYFLFSVVTLILSYMATMFPHNWFEMIIGIWALVYFFYILITFLPAWAVTVRRLHDVGISGWWVPVIPFFSTGTIVVMTQVRNEEILGLLFLILLVFSGVIGIYIFIRLVSDGEVDPNRYGENPKEDDNISAIFT